MNAFRFPVSKQPCQFPSQRKRHWRSLIGWGLLILVVAAPLSIPAGREWAAWLVSGGRALAPKGVDPVEGAWRPWDIPTDPREREAYEHAHALKLPEGLPEAVPFDFSAHWYKKRRATARAYFDHLCATEAGEYIFKTVEDVEGIYQMRSMPKPSVKLFTDRYGFEDPADWSSREADNSVGLFIGGPGNGFRYFESRRSADEIANKNKRRKWAVLAQSGSEETPYWRYQNFDYTQRTGQVVPIDSIDARYAYTWRGIQRERDREFGVAGGELIVFDWKTNEILAVRRSFAVAPQYSRNLNWEFAYYCPDNLIVRKQGVRREINKNNYPFSFILQVLHPIDYDPSKMGSF